MHVDFSTGLHALRVPGAEAVAGYAGCSHTSARALGVICNIGELRKNDVEFRNDGHQQRNNLITRVTVRFVKLQGYYAAELCANERKALVMRDASENFDRTETTTR